MINLKTDNWSLNNIDTVLFDKDGTLIDLHYFWGKMTEMRVNKIIKIFHLNPSLFKELNLCLGYNPDDGKMLPNGITALYSRSKIIEIFKKNLINYGVNVCNNSLEIIFDDVSDEFYKNIYTYTKPIESAINFVKKLKEKGIKIGIVTSDSVNSTNLIIEHFKWVDLFDTVIGRESSTYPKESGIPVKLALNNLKSKPKSSIMIGDAPTDYSSAINAGMTKYILVSTGQLSYKELINEYEFVTSTLKDVTIY